MYQIIYLVLLEDTTAWTSVQSLFMPGALRLTRAHIRVLRKVTHRKNASGMEHGTSQASAISNGAEPEYVNLIAVAVAPALTAEPLCLSSASLQFSKTLGAVLVRLSDIQPPLYGQLRFNVGKNRCFSAQKFLVLLKGTKDPITRIRGEAVEVVNSDVQCHGDTGVTTTTYTVAPVSTLVNFSMPRGGLAMVIHQKFWV